MRTADARRYIASSRGNAFVAAWISIIDQYKLPSAAAIPPEEWYTAFEDLYLSDAIDPDVFNQCDVNRMFFSGEKLNARDVDEAIWNLKVLKGMHPGEAVDNEDSFMNKRYSDSPLPDLNNMIEGPSALARIAEPRGTLAHRIGRHGELSMPDLPMLDGPMVENRQRAIEMPTEQPAMPRLSPARADVRAALACQKPASFARPHPEVANFNLTCCGESVVLEDTGGGDWHEAEGDEDHDTVDMELYGTCDRCNSSFHMGSSMPLPKGSVAQY